MIKMALLADKATNRPVLLGAVPRQSRSQQSRYRCMLVAQPLTPGGKPALVADIRLEQN